MMQNEVRSRKPEVGKWNSERASGGRFSHTSGLILQVSACLFITLFIACTNKDKIPSDVLPRDEMEKVMWDMIQADRFSSQFLERDSVAKKNLKTETFKLYEKVFQLHKITREEFVHSFKFYLDRPDINRVLFDSLSARANRRRTEVYTSGVDSAK
jgi:hypothetical protein